MNIIMDNDTLKANGLYVAALAEYTNGTYSILVDSNYYSMPKFVQRFIIAHELGHMHRQTNEVKADRNAIKQIGRIKTFFAMSYLLNYFLTIDWTVSAQYLVRMDALGYKVGALKIKAPNGRIFGVEELKHYYIDNYVEM